MSETPLALFTAHCSPLGPSARCTLPWGLSLSTLSALKPSVAICPQEGDEHPEEGNEQNVAPGAAPKASSSRCLLVQPWRRFSSMVVQGWEGLSPAA